MKIKIENRRGLADSQALNKSDLFEIIDTWREKLKVKPKRIQIRKMRNKWSSC